MHIKRFFEWILLKERLHLGTQKVPHVSEGEIWWASLGENIGFEINGKNVLFSRTVIIHKKLANGFYLVIPTTTRLQTGSWYVRFKQSNLEMEACLQHVRSIDYRRLSTRLGELDKTDFKKVRDGFIKLYV